MKKARYIRVSTSQQSTLRQELKQKEDEILFIDKGVSGAVPFNKRPAGKKLLAAILIEDITDIYVSDLSRLGRNTLDILQTIEYFHNRKINIHVDNLNGLKSLNADGTPNQMFSFITTVMSGISQMERESIRERVKDGIQAKKLTNQFKPGGRPKGTTENDAEVLKKYPKVVKMIKENPNLKQSDIAGACGVSPHTVKKIKAIVENL